MTPTRLLADLRIGVLACALCFAVFTAAAQDTRPSPEALLDQARREARLGQLRDAQQTLVAAIRRKREADGGERAAIAPYYLLLGDVLSHQGETKQAEAFYRRTLKVAQSEPDGTAADALRASVHGRLARQANRRGEDRNAELEFLNALAFGERAHGATAMELIDDRLQLARLLTRAFKIGRAREQLELGGRALDAAPADRALRAAVEQEWGEWYFRQGLDQGALTHYRKGLELREQAFGPDSLEAAQSVSSLSLVLMNMALYRQAEEALLRGTAIYQSKLGTDHEFNAPLLSNLGQLYYQQSRYAEAEAALTRARHIVASRLGPDHPAMAGVANHLGYLYLQLGRYDLARENLERARTIWAAPASARPRYAANANSLLGAVARHEGRLEESAALLESAVARLGAIYGSDNPALGDAFHEAGLTHWKAGKFTDAETALRRAVKVWESIGGPTHFNAIRVRGDLIGLYDAQHRLDEALAEARLASDGLGVHIRRNSGERTRSLAAQVSVLRETVLAHIRVLDRLAVRDPGRAAEYLAESFAVGQEARATSAAQALAEMGARFAAGEGELANLIRERQSLAERWRETDDRLAEAIVKPAGQRDFAAEAALRAQSVEIRAAIAAQDAGIAALDPGYAQLAASRTVPLADFQALLADDEAALIYLIGEADGFVWVVRRGGLALHKLAVSASDLEQAIRRLRRALVPRGLASYDNIRPFPAAIAAKLYDDVMRTAEQDLAGAAHVMIVPDGALQSLPFGVLVTGGSTRVRAPADHRAVEWLIRRHALSTLPSVGSLRVLRRLVGDVAPGTRPFIGIGDPRLAPGGGDARETPGPPGEARGRADRAFVRKLPELPETAGELRSIARTLDAGEDALFLRERADEQTVRAQPLDQYRVLQFATHGLMAGEFQGLREPALVLSAPPDGTVTDENDGLLTSSEIAQLKLNARWVILSACNTAAPNGTPGAEGLSGLAKGFFFAGSRTLLVSHWEVISEAAVALTTRLFEIQKAEPVLSAAAAMRRSMLDLMNSDHAPYLAHPMFWAPFVVVGEGG
jgi:CHAT domain-containing protein/Tfp pilus assembly protein PilF